MENPPQIISVLAIDLIFLIACAICIFATLKKTPATYLFAPLRFIFKVYFCLFFFLSLAVLYPLFYFFLSDKSRFHYAFRLKRVWALLLQFGYFSFTSVKKESELPKGPFIICSNHTSFLDIIFMYRVIPHYFIFMGKDELLKWPLFRLFFKRQDIAVNRRSASGAALAFKRCKEALMKGEAVAMFPEGTIPKTAPVLNRFKDGAFKLAIECQVPIVPVTFLSHHKMLCHPEKYWGKAQPGISRVIVHEAVSTQGMTEKDLVDLRQRIFNTIDSTLKHNGSN